MFGKPINLNGADAEGLLYTCMKSYSNREHVCRVVKPGPFAMKPESAGNISNTISDGCQSRKSNMCAIFLAGAKF